MVEKIITDVLQMMEGKGDLKNSRWPCIIFFPDTKFTKKLQKCNRERDLALIEFLYGTGVRVSELAALNRSDIDFEDMNVVIYGKGSKERETYLTEASCYHLKEYLDSRTDDNEARKYMSA